nr:unnamed protein product [Callosobruchus analis]
MLDELTFCQRFRVTKLTAMHILELIENEIEYNYDFNYSLPPINQIMIFLRLCATERTLHALVILLVFTIQQYPEQQFV